MFTGLVEDIGKLKEIRRTGKAASLLVRSSLPLGEICEGDSIAVNGVCLTVERVADGCIAFHCLAETLSRSNLGTLPCGADLNLERAMQLGARLGGHIVTGHVDFCGEVLAAGKNGDDFQLSLSFPREQRPYFVEKGSVALNGVSLTIAAMSGSSLKVCLIPVTLANTNLQCLHKGDLVNVETDMLGKYVVNSMKLEKQSNVTMEMLHSAGF